jgi:hypothetical protein
MEHPSLTLAGVCAARADQLAPAEPAAFPSLRSRSGEPPQRSKCREKAPECGPLHAPIRWLGGPTRLARLALPRCRRSIDLEAEGVGNPSTAYEHWNYPPPLAAGEPPVPARAAEAALPGTSTTTPRLPPLTRPARRKDGLNQSSLSSPTGSDGVVRSSAEPPPARGPSRVCRRRSRAGGAPSAASPPARPGDRTPRLSPRPRRSSGRRRKPPACG